MFDESNKKQAGAVQSNNNEFSGSDDVDELRSKFQKLTFDLERSRDNEKLLLVENLKYKDKIVPSLEAKIIQLELVLQGTKNKHIATISKVYDENSTTLQQLSDQNIEAAKSIETVKQNLIVAKNKLIESESKIQQANQKLTGFINSSNAVKKEYEKFYLRMSKSGDPLYPSRSRSKSP